MLKASHVIAVSQATKEDLIRLYGVNEDKVSVVYSGVSEASEVFDGEKMSEEQPKTLSLPDKYILYLGTMEPRKNIVSIIEAFASIAEDVSHDLVIAGERGWLASGVERAIKVSGEASRIHRVGLVAEGRKQELYRRADLFVYPSFYEGFGFPPLEALVAGTPVITSHNSSLPEVVGDWAVMVNPYDVSELALVMKEVLDNPPLVGEKIKKSIRKKFSWDRAARQTFTVFEKAVEE
jgi:glycosyltransferase involved in cell wall biosynthesis